MWHTAWYEGTGKPETHMRDTIPNIRLDKKRWWVLPILKDRVGSLSWGEKSPLLPMVGKWGWRPLTRMGLRVAPRGGE